MANCGDSEQLTGLAANFEDRQAMTILRRAFHTLKGAGV